MNQTFRSRLAEIVEVFGTQAEFSRVIGVDRSTVSRWLAGTAVPDMQKIITICESTGVSSDYMLGLTDRKVIDTKDIDEYDLVVCIKNITSYIEARNTFVRARKQLRLVAG